MKKAVTIILLLISYLSISASSNGTLKGTVSDAKTKQPLIGVNIIIVGSNLGATTDQSGKYIFRNLDAGTYTIQFSYIGYSKVTKTDVIVKPGRSIYLNVGMEPLPVELGNVVVSSGYFSDLKNTPVSAVTFSSEEIRRAPGSAGDVSRIMYGLPALAKVNDSRNSLIVRGGSPVENTFYIDNIEVPNINHYPVEGSSDGPIGILNVDFIEDVTFHTGGFSPAYGDKLSSIMEIDYREGNNDGILPQLNLNMAGLGGAVEGPIGNKGSFMFSTNISYLDLVADKAETGGAIPRYQDAQGKLTYNLDDQNKITLLEIFSRDEINLDYDDALKTDLTIVYGSTNGIMNVSGLNWQRLWGNIGYSNTSLAYNYQNYDHNYSETKTQRHLYTNKSSENSLVLRNVNYLKLSEFHGLDFGFDGKYYFNNFNLYYNEWQDHFGNVNPVLTVNEDFQSIKIGLFIVDHFEISEKLRLDFGLRGDYFDATRNFSLSPRATLTYDFTEAASITASAGIFRQDIPNHILVQNNKFSSLKTPLAYHNIVGISHLLSENTRLTIEGYYKYYKYFPIDPNQPSVFLFDEAATEGLFLQHESLVDNGEAYAAGVEIMVQKKLASDFYGMVSGSYSKTKYKGADNTWRNRIYDNQYNFNLEGGYVPNDEWEFKVRWIYAGGAPYTPFDIASSKAMREGIWDLSNINSKRMPDYHSLNIRVDKRFYFNNSNMIVYLSVWNAYGRENIAQYVWDEVKNEQGVQKQWSTLPVIGIEYEF
ncbi:MAG: TonB-dependent receptor [Melioribacteraceae bacterium]|nr:TonB-dependent receptor [Melioribacteraceae bacterium]MCF8353666.1 TonB-dependent receptor [Melioribacteraceae bacterium]MCF8393436.1 TonB-dependent receptor [Melioribacteraceae bacterium]MCF8419293.1 TonB-dependent receptor [Melioribacteraceae bacterium]